ncbi:MAG: hypothetical protein ABJF04_22790 [Reichenbachiella sp.]|uniref:hypothetical protein n=1 Tax=Reichenbachiella sp. TaxID=2184521 RepID=UPI003267FAD4
MENKYKPGDTVYARASPDVELMVRRYIKRIYYCQLPKQPDHKDLPFFERELL